MRSLAVLLALTGTASAFPAAYTEYTDQTAWDTADDVGTLTTLTFAAFSTTAVVSNQYTAQGATFLSNTNTALDNGAFADGKGLSMGTGGTVVFSFPVCAIGARYPDGLQFVLHDAAGAVIHTSAQFGGAGTGLFAGVLSPTPVTSVVISDWSDASANLDDLLFGPCPPNGDGDGVFDADDNCPGVDNDGQEDLDGDGYGDACDPASCGNGHVEAPETCDGDDAGTGGETTDCDLDCTAAACGDDVVNGTAGEQCETGDACEACVVTFDPGGDGTCGDGVVDPGEACEDGNTDDGDGCSADCEFEAAPAAGDGGGCSTSGAASPWLLLAALALWARRRPCHSAVSARSAIRAVIVVGATDVPPKYSPAAHREAVASVHPRGSVVATSIVRPPIVPSIENP